MWMDFGHRKAPRRAELPVPLPDSSTSESSEPEHERAVSRRDHRLRTPWKSEGATGFGMARAHARGLLASERVRIVALADPNRDNALAFQADLRANACTRITGRCCRAEKLTSSASAPGRSSTRPWSSIARKHECEPHCEKPMAPTFGECQRMVRACEENGARLTINHQRRFLNRFREAKRLLVAGAIGELERVEGALSEPLRLGARTGPRHDELLERRRTGRDGCSGNRAPRCEPASSTSRWRVRGSASSAIGTASKGCSPPARPRAGSAGSSSRAPTAG